MGNEKTTIQAVLSAAIATFAAYMGTLAVPMIVLVAMMVIDYISGMAAAWVHNELSSKVGAKGIVKKVGYMGLIVVAMGIDYLIYSGIMSVNIDIGYQMWFGLVVAVWLIINELISILENLDRLGVPIPEFIRAVLKRLKNSQEKENVS